MRSSLETRVGIFVVLALGIFVYMGIQIGSFRFDRSSYRSFPIYFKDISGLARKAEVKIAGVKVGWVESVELVPDHQMMVKANIMILRDYTLYSDAYAVVRQEGLLGPKYLEIIPGDPLMRQLEEGEALSRPSRAPVAMDEILRQVKTIATNMEEVTTSFKDAVGGIQGKEQLTDMVSNLSRAAEKLASFSDIVDRAIGRNEEKLDSLLGIGADFHRLSEKIEQQILPSLQDGVDHVTNAFDRDFDRVATSLESTSQSFEEAAIEAREGLRKFNSVVEKVDEGKGLIGKLINDEDTYKDLKVAVTGLKNYFAKIDRMQIVFDAHSETFQRPSDIYKWEDSKGYFDIRIHPNDDYFYLVQIVASERGWITRQETRRHYTDSQDRPVDPEQLHLPDFSKPWLIYNEKEEVFHRYAMRFGLQFGKIFNDLAFRFGIFDNSTGIAVDYDIPFKSDKLRWVTSLEVFDMTGWNRVDDRRPHIKWINRVFMYRNVYVTFGADDFVSRRNATAFFGFGLRFGDDDVKYLFSSLGTIATNISNEY